MQKKSDYGRVLLAALPIALFPREQLMM